jgi:hypothetical protein
VFVETLDKCFENVCELDLIFHMDKVSKRIVCHSETPTGRTPRRGLNMTPVSLYQQEMGRLLLEVFESMVQGPVVFREESVILGEEFVIKEEFAIPEEGPMSAEEKSSIIVLKSSISLKVFQRSTFKCLQVSHVTKF